jgi:hypothetical protein
METVETLPLISPEMVERRTHEIMQSLMTMRPSATWLDAHEQLLGLTSPYLEFLKTNPTVFIVRELLGTKVMTAAARYVSELHARNTLSTAISSKLSLSATASSMKIIGRVAASTVGYVGRGQRSETLESCSRTR